MNFVHADIVSLSLFCIFSIAMLFLYLYVFRRYEIEKKWQFGFILFVCLSSILSFSGLMGRWIFPLVPLFMCSLFIIGILFSISLAGKKLSRSLSLYLLVGFQSFRLPLEIILHHWSDLGTVPKTMTWTGSNWDIVAGILSFVSIPLVRKNKEIGYIINAIGFLFLMNVLRVVVLSSPFPFSWTLENPLQLVLYFPYVLIAPLFVLPAFVCHLLVFQKMKGTI